MMGDPAVSGYHLTPSNLRGPLRPNLLATSCWSSVSTLTANILPLAIRGQVFDVSAGQKTTSGGSKERAAKAWQAKPTGSPSSIALITVTPVQKWPSTCLNFWGSGKWLTGSESAHRRPG